MKIQNTDREKLIHIETCIIQARDPKEAAEYILELFKNWQTVSPAIQGYEPKKVVYDEMREDLDNNFLYQVNKNTK